MAFSRICSLDDLWEGDMAAYEYFAKGRDHFSRNTPKAIAQAQQEFEKALSLNPRFAAAHAYVGWNHSVAGVWWSKDREEAFRAARAAADTALSLNETLADAHAVHAFVDLYSGEHARAEAREIECLGAAHAVGRARDDGNLPFDY